MYKIIQNHTFFSIFQFSISTSIATEMLSLMWGVVAGDNMDHRREGHMIKRDKNLTEENPLISHRVMIEMKI